jgi:hypothetical protein
MRPYNHLSHQVDSAAGHANAVAAPEGRHAIDPVLSSMLGPAVLRLCVRLRAQA